MDSRRQNKFNRLLLKEISAYFQKNPHYAKGGLITVTDVKVTSDLSIARVYLSFIATKDPQKALDAITDHTSSIRGDVGTLIRNQLRKIPELHFFHDDTADYAQKMDKIIDDLHIPPSEEDDKK
jgi:ribosome-binding factor A